MKKKGWKITGKRQWIEEKRLEWVSKRARERERRRSAPLHIATVGSEWLQPVVLHVRSRSTNRHAHWLVDLSSAIHSGFIYQTQICPAPSVITKEIRRVKGSERVCEKSGGAFGGDAALEETEDRGMEHLSTRELPRLSWIDTLYSSTYWSLFPQCVCVCVRVVLNLLVLMLLSSALFEWGSQMLFSNCLICDDCQDKWINLEVKTYHGIYQSTLVFLICLCTIVSLQYFYCM